MAFLRTRILSSTSACAWKNLRLHPFKRDFRMSAKLSADIEEIKNSNPFYEKYSEKLKKAQATAEKKDAKAPAKKGISSTTTVDRDYSELLRPKKSLSKIVENVGPKKLSDIMKLELLEDKTVDEIKTIWLEYHKKKSDVISAVIPVEVFDSMTTNGKVYPTFIIPLPRSQGYEFILLQFATDKSIHFTPLLCFQVHKENSAECLNITHYTEFRDQGIVLMRGTFDPKVLSTLEAVCLANQLKLYYTGNDSKLKLLETFNKQPDKFSHLDVIKELENLSIE